MDLHKNHNKNDKEHVEKPDGVKEKTVTLSDAEYKELKEQAAKAQEYWERILRLQADFDNTRKRLERDRQEYVKFANEGMVAELLNILDDLERATELAQEKHQDLSAFLKGIEMILAHLYDMLKERGVKPIESEGKKFDPNFHEALLQVENNSVPEHTIVEELQKGYMIYDRVLRTAKVKVSKSTDNREQGAENKP